MAIVQRYSTNAAVQYNESLTDYLIADNATGKKFLTNAPLNRLIRENELSALYFLIDDSSFVGATILRFKDEDGNILYEENTPISSTYNIHNGLLVGFSGVPYYVPDNTTKICALISGSPNLFLNPDFAIGSGNLFTSWTLTQPSRTNILLYSNTFQNATWTKIDVTATDNSGIAPDGTTTAALIQLGAGTTIKGIAQSVAIASTNDRVAHFSVKQGSHRYVQIQIDGAFIFCNFDLQLGTIGNATGCTGDIYQEDNGFYRCIIKYNSDKISPILWAVDSLSSGGAAPTASTGTFYVNLAQSEVGAFATPAILTTNLSVTTSLGEFLQDATGGVDGGRALLMWADNGSDTTYLRQARSLVSDTEYKIRLFVKLYDTASSPQIFYRVNGGAWTLMGVPTSSYSILEVTYLSLATSSQNIDFKYTNAGVYGFVLLDKASITDADENALTEERCFELDTRCFPTETTIQWINKLGGVDTWTFTGNPIQTRNTEREGLIEYPMQDNYESPNEIYAYRSIKSHEVMNLFHRCENEETAIWLRSELQDTIQAYVKVGDDYHPIIPTTSSVQIRNWAQRDPNVRFTFRFAYDINIQRR